MPSPRIVDLRKGGATVRRTLSYTPPPRRNSPLRQKRRRLRAAITAGVCVFLMGLGYALHLFSYSERMTYQSVTVIGAQSLSQSEIQAYVQERLIASSHGFISGRNIFVFKMPPLEKSLVARFARIKEARAVRDSALGNGLSITIVERSAYARWCGMGECFLVDDIGLVFAPAATVATSTVATGYIFQGMLSTTTETLNVSHPLGDFFALGHFKGLTDLLVDLAESGYPTSGITLESEQDFSVHLVEGFYLKASYGESAANLVKNLELILSSDVLKEKRDTIEYVDLRFGNRVYYKLKGETQSE